MFLQKNITLALLCAPFFILAQNPAAPVGKADFQPEIAETRHLRNIQQLTFGGDNAEAYWSPNSKMLTFQSNNPKWGLQCDQIFAMKVKKAANDPTYMPQPISNGKGYSTNVVGEHTHGYISFFGVAIRYATLLGYKLYGGLKYICIVV